MKKVFRGLPSPEERLDCAVAIGNFDGVHRGHQALLHEVVEAAHARLLCPAVLTFEPHPREFFNPEDAPRRISSLHDKVEAIEACGIQRVYILRFNEHLASLSPCDFVKEILVDGLHARWVTEKISVSETNAPATSSFWNSWEKSFTSKFILCRCFSTRMRRSRAPASVMLLPREIFRQPTTC